MFPLMFIVSAVLLALTGCTSVQDLGGGRWAVPETVEVRSPFGTNAGYVRLQNCAREATSNPSFSQYDYVNCHTMHGWTPTQSQGQGGQVAIGMGIGLGAGIGGVLGGASSSATAGSSSSSSAISVVPAGGGGHGGHH